MSNISFSILYTGWFHLGDRHCSSPK